MEGGVLRPLRPSQIYRPDVMEDIHVKAELGRYRFRGFGTLRPRPLPSFDDLTFIPCSLTRIPLEGYRERCRTTTVLGTRHAKRPIELEIPVMITGMSWGALSYNAKVALAQGARAAGTSTTTGRRRHAAGGAGTLPRPRVRGAPEPIRHERPSPPLGRRDRAHRGPGRQARHGRHAARLQDLRRDRRGPRAAAGRGPAQPGAAPGLARPRRHDHQDRGAARGHRLAGSDLREDGRHARLRRRQAGREGRGRRRGGGRHGGRHRGVAGHPPGPHGHPDAGRRLRGAPGAPGHGPLRPGPAHHRGRNPVRRRCGQGPGARRRRGLHRDGGADRAQLQQADPPRGLRGARHGALRLPPLPHRPLPGRDHHPGSRAHEASARFPRPPSGSRISSTP